jgi:D-alanyl-lipoteichoic acid biosynthesis protein DltD
MKQIIINYLLPLIISIASVWCLAFTNPVNELLFGKNIPSEAKLNESNYFENFTNNAALENQFLKQQDTGKIIYLLGSSELAEKSEAIPQTFISKHFTTPVIAIGHAGNQCFSIYAQLLANAERLKNSSVVIILSPGWFESKPAKGTSSAIFLEFNSPRFQNKLVHHTNTDEFTAYANKRMAQLYTEFNAPSLELKLMNFSHKASLSPIHKSLFFAPILVDQKLLQLKEALNTANNSDTKLLNGTRYLTYAPAVNWDSLENKSEQEVLAAATNNTLGISNEYYSQYINGKSGHIQTVPNSVNQELEDFYFLVKLLKAKEVNASFIISPLNALYYKNINDLSPVIKELETSLQSNQFKYLNLFEANPEKYNKAMLHDVMHLSDYGWYQVNQFIVDTYQLKQ